MNSHAFSAIRTRDVSNREIGDLRLRQYGLRDRRSEIAELILTYHQLNFNRRISFLLNKSKYYLIIDRDDMLYPSKQIALFQKILLDSVKIVKRKPLRSFKTVSVHLPVHMTSHLQLPSCENLKQCIRGTYRKS